MFGATIRGRVRESGLCRHQRAVQRGNSEGNQCQMERKSICIHVSVTTVYNI